MTLATVGMLFCLLALAFAVLDAIDLWPDDVGCWVNRHAEALYTFFGSGFLLGAALTLGAAIIEVAR